MTRWTRPIWQPWPSSCRTANCWPPTAVIWRSTTTSPPISQASPNFSGSSASLFRHSCAEPGGPAGKSSLLAAGDGELVGRHILGHDRAGADDCTRADTDGCHQRRVGPDESSGPDVRLILAEAVKIA